MASVLLFFVLAGVVLRVVYALARPLFWTAFGVVLFIGLLLVFVLAFPGLFMGLGV